MIACPAWDPRTATIFARLLSGGEVDQGDVDAVPPSLDDLARRLNAVTVDARPAIWKGFLSDRNDAASIRNALARAPIEGPLPEVAPIMVSSGPDPGAALDVKSCPIGTRVKALDRGNVGEVVGYDGRTVTVNFLSASGHEATVPFDRAQLLPLDGPAAAPECVPPLKFEILTATEFDRTEFRMEWLIEGVLVADQPCVVAGPKKALKTSLMMDLAVSIASGLPFLGRFEVPKQVPVLFMSGESGGFALQETARRVCQAKGIGPDFGPILERYSRWCSGVSAMPEVIPALRRAELVLQAPQQVP